MPTEEGPPGQVRDEGSPTRRAGGEAGQKTCPSRELAPTQPSAHACLQPCQEGLFPLSGAAQRGEMPSLLRCAAGRCKLRVTPDDPASQLEPLGQWGAKLGPL